MTYSGIFKDRLGDDITVVITTPESGQDVSIGDQWEDDLQFAASPLTISSEMDDTTSVIVYHTAQLTLQVKSYLADSLFASNERNIQLDVYKGLQPLFVGYVEPNIFNQPYDHTWNQLTLNATDLLSTLQYRPWRNIKTLADWALWRKDADQLSLMDIIRITFQKVAEERALRIFYDGSVRLSQNSSALSIFDVQISESILLGDEYDDILQSDEVLDTVLKYFNLHIRQEGGDIFIYHLSSQKQATSITWTPVLAYSDEAYILLMDECTYNDAGDAFEILQKTNNKQLRLRGNMLEKVLSSQLEEKDGAYVYYYYWVLPNGRRIKSKYYEEDRDIPPLDYIHKPQKPTPYRILSQDEDGNYFYDQLDNAPNRAYDGSTFVKPYYEAAEGEYIIAQR